MQPNRPIPGQNVSTTDDIVFDPELFVSTKRLKSKEVEKRVARFNTLSDQLRTAHARVNLQVNRIRIRLEEMWKKNSIFRKRGLKGGRARAQQAKKGRLAACLQDLTPEQHKRRKEVERKDFKGRSQIEGLNQILTIFEDSFQFIHAQKDNAERVIDAGRKIARGVATPSEAWTVAMADEVLLDAATNKEIDDIEAMLEAFLDEYGL